MAIEKKKYEAYVQAYKKDRMPVEKARYERAQKQRENFLDRFPVNKIKKLSLEEYAFKKGNKTSFSSIMYSELEDIAHAGNAYTHMFGIYFKDGKQLMLSSTYKNLFGNDYERAFSQVKEDITALLTEIDKDNFDAAVKKNCRLHNTFKYKLLAVYFPEKFLPVCTQNMMKVICDTMSVPFDKKEMIYSNIALREMKEASPLTKEWNNGVFLGFCRWIGNNFSTSNGKKITVSFAKEIDDAVDTLQLQGDTREAVVKLRVNQSIFREELLKRYGKCVLCGIEKNELLIASHIQPWKDSKPEEKVDVDNGFLFCPNHDKLFDKGLISFNNKGEIIISDSLDKVNSTYVNVRPGMAIELTEGNKKYLSFHRKNVFK